MSNYSYSKQISQNKVVFSELDIETVKKIFTKIFKSYNPKVKDEVFDSFCEDFYEVAKEIHGLNERIWRMIITDMLFNYDEKGYLEAGAKDNGIKRKQFAVIARYEPKIRQQLKNLMISCNHVIEVNMFNNFRRGNGIKRVSIRRTEATIKESSKFRCKLQTIWRKCT